MAFSAALQLDPAGDAPLFVAIAAAVARDIARGRLKPGARLPGTRSLAASLGVHRNTVIAAYAELEAEGWVVSERARGTFVALAKAVDRPRRFAREVGPRPAVPRRLGFELAARAQMIEPFGGPAPARFDLRGGLPDLRLVPHALLARAYRRALKRQGRALLDYGDPRGHAELRAGLAEMLSTLRGLAPDADDVMVTRGSQMGLWLAGQVLLEPGDGVAVESFGYAPAWRALAGTGARLHPIRVDEQGMVVADLEALLQRERVRAVYLTPHHQYPTTVVLSAGRRLRLLELAREHRFAVLEDDYDNEFHYDGRPVLPLASADRAGVVVYVGTLSKVLAPGLRIGFVVAPPALVERMAALRVQVDRQGDLATEAAVAELIADGELSRHVHRMRRAFHARRDLLVARLAELFGERLRFRVPAGGLALWAKAPGVDVNAWASESLARGVSVRAARDFAFDGKSRPFLRIGFGRANEAELFEATELLKKAMPRA